MFVSPLSLSNPLPPNQSSLPLQAKEEPQPIILSETLFNLLVQHGMIDETEAWTTRDEDLPPVEKKNIHDLIKMLNQARIIKFGDYQVKIKLIDLFHFMRTKVKAKSIEIVGGSVTSLLTDYLDKILASFGITLTNTRVVPINSLNFCVRFPHEIVFIPTHYENEEDDLTVIQRCLKEYFLKLMIEQTAPSLGKEELEKEIDNAKLFDRIDNSFLNLNIYDEKEKLPIRLKFSFDFPGDVAHYRSEGLYRGATPFIKDDLYLCLNPLLGNDYENKIEKLYFSTYSSRPLQSVIEAQTEILHQANVETILETAWEEFVYEVMRGKCCYQKDFEEALWVKMAEAAKDKGQTEQEAAESLLRRCIETNHLQQNHKAIIALCANAYAFISRRNKEDLAAKIWLNVQGEFLKEPTDPLIQNLDRLVQEKQVKEAFALLQVIAFLNLCSLSRSSLKKNRFQKEFEPVIRFSLDKDIYLLLPFDPLPHLKILSSLKSSHDPFSLFPKNYHLGMESYPKGYSIKEINWKELVDLAQDWLGKENPFLKRLGFELILAWGTTNNNPQAYNLLKEIWPFIFENKLENKLNALPLNENQINELANNGRKHKQSLKEICTNCLPEDPEKALSVFLNIRSDVVVEDRKALLDTIYEVIRQKGPAFFRAHLRKLTKAYKDLLSEDKNLVNSDKMPNILKELFRGLLIVTEWQEAMSLIPYGLQCPTFMQDWFEPMVQHPCGGFRAIYWIKENRGELYEQIIQKIFNEGQSFHLLELYCRYQEFSLAAELLHKMMTEDTLPALNLQLKQEDLKQMPQENKRGLLQNLCKKLTKETKQKWLESLCQNANSLPSDDWEILVALLSIEFPLKSLEILESSKESDEAMAAQVITHCWNSCLQGLAKSNKIVSFIHDFFGFLNRFPKEHQEEAACHLFRRTLLQKKPELVTRLKEILKDLSADEKYQGLKKILDFELIRAGVIFNSVELIHESVEKMESFIRNRHSNIQEKHIDLLGDIFEKNLGHTPFLLQLTKPVMENPAWQKGLRSLIGHLGKKIPPEFAKEVLHYIKNLLDQSSSSIEQNLKMELIYCVNRFIRSSHPLEKDFLDSLFDCLNHAQFIPFFGKEVKGQIFQALFQKKKRSLGVDVTNIKEFLQFFSDHLSELSSLWTLKERRKELEELFERLLKIQEASDVLITETLHLMGLSELYDSFEDITFCQNLPHSTSSSLVFDKPLDAFLPTKTSHRQQLVWENAQNYVNNRKIRMLSVRIPKNCEDLKERNRALTEVGRGLKHLLPLKQYDDVSLLDLLERYVFYAFFQDEEQAHQEHLIRAKTIIKSACIHLESSSALVACDFYAGDLPKETKALSVDICKKILNFIAEKKPADHISFQLLEKLQTKVPRRPEITRLIHEISWELFERAPQHLKFRYFDLTFHYLETAKDFFENKSLYYERVKVLLDNCSNDSKFLIPRCKTISKLFDLENPPIASQRIRGKNAKKRLKNHPKTTSQPKKEELANPETSQSRGAAWQRWLQLLVDANTPETLHIFTHTALPNDLCQFSPEVIMKLRKSWLDMMLVSFEGTSQDPFSEVENAWSTTLKINLWESIGKLEDCPEYFQFLEKMIEHCLQQKTFTANNAAFLSECLKKMKQCGVVLKDSLLTALVDKGKTLRSDPALFSIYEAFLSTSGLITLTLQLSLMQIFPRLGAEPLCDSAKVIKDAFKNINEDVLQQNDFLHNENLWKLIRDLFTKFLSYQFQKNLLLSREDTESAIQNSYTLMQLSLFKELLRREQNLKGTFFLKKVQDAIFLTYDLGDKNYNHYREKFLQIIQGDNRLETIPANYVSEVKKKATQFIETLMKLTQVNPLSALRDCLEEGVCLSNDPNFCKQILQVMIKRLNRTQQWSNGNPHLEISCLMAGMRILSLGRIPFFELFPFFSEFLNILQRDGSINSIDLLYFLFADLITSCSSQQVFNNNKKAIFAAWKQLSDFRVEENILQYKKEMFFKVDVFLAHLYSKYGTYTDCLEFLSHFQKTDLASLQTQQMLPNFLRLYDILLVMKQRTFPENKSLLPQIALIAQNFGTRHPENFFEIVLGFALLENDHKPSSQLANTLTLWTNLYLKQNKITPGLVLRALWALTEYNWPSEDILLLWRRFINKFFKEGGDLKQEIVDLYTLFLRRTYKNSEVTNLFISALSEQFSKSKTSPTSEEYEKIVDCIEENLRLSKMSHLINKVEDLYSITKLNLEELLALARKKVNRNSELFSPRLDKKLLQAKTCLFSNKRSSSKKRSGTKNSD